MACCGPSLSKDNVTSYVLGRLGSPTINVELSKVQICIAIDDALIEFQRYIPIPEVEGRVLGQGIHQIPVDDAHMGLLDIEFIDAVSIDGLTIEAALLTDPWAFIAAGVPNIDVQYYDLQKNWIETMDRVFESESAHYYDGKNVYIRLARESKVTFTWAKRITDPQEIPEEYGKLFKDMTLAISMEILGNIRGKFNGVPSAAGGTVAMDGDYLRQRGAEEQNRVKNELAKMSDWILPSLG